MTEKSIETICPQSRQQWRQWLHENHDLKRSIWLIYYKKQSGMPTVNWSEAVDEALCFRWIDSKKQSIDEEKYMQFFCRRKLNSTWSKVNKAKIQRLAEAGLMTQAGFNSIETAKLNGSWAILGEVEELIMPEDLDREFQKSPGSKSYFLSLSMSDRRNILQWLVFAKRQQTRLKRIQEIGEMVVQKLKPSQFR